jgi:hypothetical protein
MNASIYRNAITPKSEIDPDDLALQQYTEGEKRTWLANPITKDLIKQLETKKDQLLQKAMNDNVAGVATSITLARAKTLTDIICQLKK